MTRQISAAVVDSSALMCIVKNEPAASLFLNELSAVNDLYISAVTLSEVLLAAMSVTGSGVLAPMRQLIAALGIATVDYCGADVDEYMRAAAVHHLKAQPPGLLNMGDVFAYQLAQKMDLPLFFQGLDFLSTPVKNAMALRGYVMDASNKGVPTAQPAIP